ncbi:MAG TPA: hypothetical protein VI603_12180 [Saprospiraceae bacterium]|nr:hypothetical protein [Saprospiraceae bacterium]
MLLARYHVLFLLSAIVVVACAGSQQKTRQKDIVSLEKNIMQIHDEVMPKMSEIARLIPALETEAKNSNLDSILHQQIAKSIAELNAGDSLMWEWMHNYKMPENVSPDSIHAYLQSEKARISKVRDAMLTGIKNAESLLQKLGHVQPN